MATSQTPPLVSEWYVKSPLLDDMAFRVANAKILSEENLGRTLSETARAAHTEAARDESFARLRRELVKAFSGLGIDDSAVSKGPLDSGPLVGAMLVTVPPTAAVTPRDLERKTLEAVSATYTAVCRLLPRLEAQREAHLDLQDDGEIAVKLVAFDGEHARVRTIERKDLASVTKELANAVAAPGLTRGLGFSHLAKASGA